MYRAGGNGRMELNPTPLLCFLPWEGPSRASCSLSAATQTLRICLVRTGHSPWPQAQYCQPSALALVLLGKQSCLFQSWFSPVGSICTHQSSWSHPCLPKLGSARFAKGNMCRWALEPLNCPPSIWDRVAKSFLFCLSFHQPGSLPRAFMAFANTNSSRRRSKERSVGTTF